MDILHYLGFISICYVLLGCHTIHQEILGEKDQLTSGELQGIWDQKKLTPIIHKVVTRETQKAKIEKWLQKLIEYTLQKLRNLAEKQNLSPLSKNPPPKNIPFPDNSESVDDEIFYFSPYIEDEYIPISRRSLFLEPGEEGKRATIEFYLPQRAPSRWKWIVSPSVETNVKDPSQSLFDYVSATIIKNIENIQGKVGIVLEW